MKRKLTRLMKNNETILRRKLTLIAKKAYEHHLMTGTWGNLSARVDKDKILITPSGFEKDLLKANDLLLINLNGKILRGKWNPSIETPIHTYIYHVRDDVHGIVHTHSHYATVFAVMGESIPPLTVEFATVIGHEIPVTKYVRSGTREAAEEIVKTLRDGKAVLLKNHGVVAVGESIEEAYHVALLVEEEARTYYLMKLLGSPIDTINSEEIKILHDFYIKKYGQWGKKILLRD